MKLVFLITQRISALVLIVLTAPIILCGFLVSALYTKSPLFVQTRVGQCLTPFELYKIRTLPKNTPNVASHDLPIGASCVPLEFLRKRKIDELPQLFNIFLGDLNFVGYRPCLETQTCLISHRKTFGIHIEKPGITGLSQLYGVTMKRPYLQAKIDSFMINMSLPAKVYILVLTVLIVLRGKRLRRFPRRIIF